MQCGTQSRTAQKVQMNYIRQEHRTGCGIACVAMIADVSYLEVLEIARQKFRWLDTRRTFYTSSKQLQELLCAFKIKAQKGRAIRKWSSLPEMAIVGINHNKKSDTWHWVIFRRDADVMYVHDPQSKHGTRTDFGRMRLRSCMPIDLTWRSTRTHKTLRVLRSG